MVPILVESRWRSEAAPLPERIWCASAADSRRGWCIGERWIDIGHPLPSTIVPDQSFQLVNVVVMGCL